MNLLNLLSVLYYQLQYYLFSKILVIRAKLQDLINRQNIPINLIKYAKKRLFNIP